MTALAIAWWIIGLAFSVGSLLEVREGVPRYMRTHWVADAAAALAISPAGPMPYLLWWAGTISSDRKQGGAA